MYATPSLSELKAIAAKLNIVPTGDKRSKQSWINAIEAHVLLSDSMPELPSHAEQETIAIAADMVMAVTTEAESITKPVTTESVTSDAGVTDYGDISNSTSEAPFQDKRGAATVFTAPVVTVIVAIRAMLIGTCAVARLAILIGSMFGRYNPDYDLWHHLQQRVKPPQPSYS